ncbi:MAG: fumarate hydratase, partial [Paludibacter sp.]|nr:fumarate hydratase [Paludibacter sp.]
MAKEFSYQDPFPTGKDTTEYYLLTDEHVQVAHFDGQEVLKVEAEGITKMARTAMRDCSFLLRPEHQKQV